MPPTQYFLKVGGTAYLVQNIFELKVCYWTLKKVVTWQERTWKYRTQNACYWKINFIFLRIINKWEGRWKNALSQWLDVMETKRNCFTFLSSFWKWKLLHQILFTRLDKLTGEWFQCTLWCSYWKKIVIDKRNMY